MKITLDALLVVDAIDRRGSFAAAADVLHRVPSAVTYSVQKLEQGLGVALFRRVGRRAELTDAGRTLLDRGRVLLESAGALERAVQRVSSGWERELRVALSDVVPDHWVLRLLERFYQVAPDTRLRITREVLSGTWDALIARRTDLVIGAVEGPPPGGGFHAEPLMSLSFAFAVAPGHPLAAAPEPLSEARIREHRIVAVADTSRVLAPRTHGILAGQPVLTVATQEAKREAQCLGLGVGYLPRHLIVEDLRAGRLVEKRTEGGLSGTDLYLAWPRGEAGRARDWLVEQVRKWGSHGMPA